MLGAPVSVARGAMEQTWDRLAIQRAEDPTQVGAAGNGCVPHVLRLPTRFG
jgi:hypothetical protein